MRRVAVACALVGIVLGAVVLVGWAADVLPMQRVLPGLPKTTANTAVGMLLCGVALLGLTASRSRFLRIAGAAAVVLAALLPAATLLEYATGWDLGIDQLLFHEEIGVATTIPGRPAPQTALTLLLLAGGIATLSVRRLWQATVGQMLLIAAFILSLIGVHAHLQGAEALFGAPGRMPYTGMGLLTATGLLFESAGALLARPRGRLTGFLADRGVVGSFARQAMLFIALLSPLLVAAVLVAGRAMGLYGWRVEAALFGTLLTLTGAVAVARIATFGRRREAEKALLVERERVAQKEAARAQQELAELRREHISLVSHDLRTPVSAIALAASLLEESLREHGKGDGGPEELRAIVRNVQRLKSMIDELNDVTAFERGIQPAEQRIAPGPFVREAVAEALPGTEAGRVRVEVDPEAKAILADPALLDRVLVNILANAAKYGTPGTPIDVRVQGVDAKVQVQIQNRGPVLDEDEVKRIFDKHFRARSSKGSTQGLGLGLYISRLIVEAHGGRIWAQSGTDQGTTFVVEMPCAECHAAPAA